MLSFLLSLTSSSGLSAQNSYSFYFAVALGCLLVTTIAARSTHSQYDSDGRAKKDSLTMTLATAAAGVLATTVAAAATQTTYHQKEVLEPNTDKEKTFRHDRGITTLVDTVPSKAAKKEAKKKEYTVEQVAKCTTDEKMWITIHDKVYDITNFAHVHPGGYIQLKDMAGKDCTDAFENYHQGRVTQKYLSTLLVGTLKDAPPVPPHIQDFRDVQQELLRQGYFKPNHYYYARMYAWLASLFVGAIYLSVACSSTAAHMAGAVLLGIYFQQSAGIGHDLGHSSVNQSFYIDHVLGSSLFGATMGISSIWWRKSHSTHHVVCNSVADDPDIQLLPVFAPSGHMMQDIKYWSTYHSRYFIIDPITKFLVKYQHLLFVPIMMLARFNLYAQSWITLLGENDGGKIMTHRNMEFCSLGVFLLWLSYVTLSMNSWLESAAWLLLSHSISGILHVQIIISHWAEDYNVSTEDWYRLSLDTTLDVTCPEWFDFVHIGLQHQIEHHMFPMLPRHSLRAARSMVMKVCKKHDIPYREYTFWGAVQRNFQNLKDIANGVSKESGKEKLKDFLNATG